MMIVLASIDCQLPIRTTSHSATSSKSSKNGISRSWLNFSESEAEAPDRRSVVNAWLRSLPNSSQVW